MATLNFQTIKSFKIPNYNVTVEWEGIESHIERYTERYKLDFNPDFQRGYVWTKKQKSEYIEYIMRGGCSGKDIYFNFPNWMNFTLNKTDVQMVLVDGKQRLTAVTDFLNDKVKVFGGYVCSEIEDARLHNFDFVFHVNNLINHNDVIDWYVSMNNGGTTHGKKDIERALNCIK